MSENLIHKVGKNIQEKSNLIWEVATTLAGPFKPHEYGTVILPMAIIKRFHDCLLPAHDKVVKKSAELDAKKIAVKDGFLKKASGYHFYNTSKYTFKTLLADSGNIADNFTDYLNGFSENVQDILRKMNFQPTVDRMVESDCLYQVISQFAEEKGDMSPEKISSVDMGYIFEELVRKFSESYNEEAGAHFTSRDIIYLMCDLLTEGPARPRKGDNAVTVYDMAMGTSQMLTCMTERLNELDPKLEVKLYGQEINPFTYGIAKADMLIRGGNPDDMRYGDTLSDDKFGGYEFDYIISNPPFGIDWKKEAKSVEDEAETGEAGRFAPGLPPKSDGQMLFLLNGLSKLKDTGRMAIIQNGSPLFSGDAGSGPSEIRRYLIEHDFLEAIIQLPNDSFYNTGIATYIWIVTKEKEPGRKGKIQLIDASQCYEQRRKSIGNKRVDISDDCRVEIMRVFAAWRSIGRVKSRIFKGEDFGYAKIFLTSKAGKDTENVPLGEDIDAYVKREVLPYQPDAKVDKKKTKIGYEIPFTRTFYEYKPIEPADEIAKRIEAHERNLMAQLKELFGGRK